jgi:hypothetical protein
MTADADTMRVPRADGVADLRVELAEVSQVDSTRQAEKSYEAAKASRQQYL